MKNKIIDSHFHIWNIEKQNLPWLQSCPDIDKTYTIDDYKKMYERNDVEFLGGVYVEVDGDDPILEDKIINEIQTKEDKILGTSLRAKVSKTMRVPLMANAIREPLHTDDAPKGKCLEKDFIEGVKLMTKNGYPFDVCIRVHELNDLVEMMKQVPDAKIVLDHLGNVEKLDDEYKNAMKELAKYENLYVKVSGYNTSDKKFVKELLQFVKETFRKDRLMYASNWPVVDLYSNFNEHLDLLLEAFGGDEDFFVNNAKRCYNLK